MVIFLQLCIFLVFAVLRGRTLFGAHLWPIAPGSDVLSFVLQYRNDRYSRHVGLAGSGGIPFVVRRERPYHRLLKNIGLSSEIKVGNPKFDEHYFLTTDFPGHLEQLLASEELQRHIHELFKLPIKSLHVTRHRIWCVIGYGDVSRGDDYFDTHLALLREILEDTRASRVRGLASPGWRWQGGAAFAFIAVQAGLLTLGVLGFLPAYADSIHTADMGWLVVLGTAAGLLAAVIWLCLIGALFGGSSWSAWVMADFVLCGLLGFVLSGMTVVRDVNVQLSQPEAGIYEQPVLQKICVLYCKKGSRKRAQRRSYTYDTEAACAPSSRQQIMVSKQRSDSICASSAWFGYTLVVKHWRKPEAYSFTTRPDVFDAVKIKERVRLPVNPGALGLEWLDWDEITAP